MRILIILISITAIAATIVTIIVGQHSFDGLVVEKPYETGLAWDEMHRKQTVLGWTASVHGAPFKTGKNELAVKIQDKNGSLITDAAVSITITRPSTRAYDRAYQTIRQPDGRYHTSVDLFLYGNWDVIIDAIRNNDCASFKKSIFAEQSAE